MHQHIASVPLEKASRLINHGPTILVSACPGGVQNVMAVPLACALDFAPPKLTVVLDKIAKTWELGEQSCTFVIQVPTMAQLNLTHQVDTRRLFREPDKLAQSTVELFEIDGYDLPFVEGCSAWLACKLIPEPHNQKTYDLFIGEVVGAWADTRAFNDGNWHFEDVDPAWRSLHYIAEGHFYAIGGGVQSGIWSLKESTTLRFAADEATNNRGSFITFFWLIELSIRVVACLVQQRTGRSPEIAAIFFLASWKMFRASASEMKSCPLRCDNNVQTFTIGKLVLLISRLSIAEQVSVNTVFLCKINSLLIMETALDGIALRLQYHLFTKLFIFKYLIYINKIGYFNTISNTCLALRSTA